MGLFSDPGDCVICGAAHCSCDAGPIAIPQLPARDAAHGLMVDAPRAPAVADPDAAPPALPADTFTSGTYRRPKK